MKPGYKFLFLLVSIFVILEVSHCTDDESKHEVAKGPESIPKNRYIVEKTQNVTEKREAVPGSVDDGFQESFRKVRKVHRKLINKKLKQYDETEDLERKRIKDSGEAPKKNIEEVQHVVQKMKIVENPSYPTDKENINALKQKGNTADGSETQKKITRFETITQDDNKAEHDKENVAKVLPATETKRKSILESEIEREEESDTADSHNTKQRKRIITFPERKGKRVIRTIYVTKGKNMHSEEAHDNLESEYTDLKKSVTGTTSHEKEAGADTKKHTNAVETEEKNDENRQTLSMKRKKFTEVEDEKNTETDEIIPSSDSDPQIKTRRIIVRRPVKIIRKNISRSAKEEEQNENRREEETFVDREVSSVPVRRKKKIITTSEAEKDRSKNTVEGAENSETVIEKPEGQESVEHITIKRIRSGKDTKRSDKSNREDVEIITDSEEPLFESKTDITSKPKRITRRIITETTENEAGSENDADRKKILNAIDKTDLDSDKKTIKHNVSEKEEEDVSVDTGKAKQTVDIGAQKEENVEVHTEKTIYITVSQPKLKREPSQILETETVDKSVPSERKTRTVSRTVTDSDEVADDKTTVKPRKVRTTKKPTTEKVGTATAATKSKVIADIEEEIRLMLLDEPQTEKTMRSQRPKSPKETKKIVVVTRKLESGSEQPEKHHKPIDTYANVVESTGKAHRVLANKNKIVTTKIHEDDTEDPKSPTTAPRIIIKDKVLTEIKIPQEDTNIHGTKLAKSKNVDNMESGADTVDVREHQSAVVKRKIKPRTSKDGIHITETEVTDKIHKVKSKKLTKSDIQKGGIQVTETDTDKKTTVVQDDIKPHSTSVKKISRTEPEAEKKEVDMRHGVKLQKDETGETNIIKSPAKVVKRVVIETDAAKDGTVMPETHPEIRPSEEDETPISSTPASDTQKDHDFSEIENVTKKLPDDIEIIDKTRKLSPSKRLKKIITTTIITETQKEHDDTKLKSEDDKVKPAKETRVNSESSTITVKKANKIGSEIQKEDAVVPQIETEINKVELIEEALKVPESRTVAVKKVRKEDTEEIKPTKETEKSSESSAVVVNMKKIDSETQKEDSEFGTENTKVKPIKETDETPGTGKSIVKVDSETEKEDTEVGTRTSEAKTTEESEITPEPSSAIIVRKVNTVDSQTQKEDTEINSKDNEPGKSPKSRTRIVKKVKKVESETDKQDAEVDTKTNEVIPTKEVEKNLESSTVIVRKVKKVDSETHKDEPHEDTKTHKIETFKEDEKAPESSIVIVKKEKKIDSETEKDASEDDNKAHEVKTTKETRKAPESRTVVVKKVKKTDSETPSNESEDDTKTHEIETTKETGKAPEPGAVTVKKVKKVYSETQKDISEDDNKTNEVKTVKETGKTSEVVEKINKIDSETQTNVPEDDTKSHEVKTAKEIGNVPESRAVIVKNIKKTDSEKENEPSDISEVVTKGKIASSEVKSSKYTEKAPDTSTVIVNKVTRIDTETQQDDTEDDTKTDVVKPTKEIGKTSESGTVVVKKVKKTGSETQKESADVLVEGTEPEVQSGEVRPPKDADNAPKISTVTVNRAGKDDSETEKEGVDVSEIKTTIKKHTADVELKDKLEKQPESRTTINKRIVVESETPTEDIKVSDHDHKLKKQPAPTEVVETRKFIQPDTHKDYIKDGEVDIRKENQYIISERANKVKNLPEEAKTTVVTSKRVDSAIEKEESGKKTEHMHMANEPKADTALTTSDTKISSEIEDEKNARKDKHFDNVVKKTTQTVTSESEKDNVDTEKEQVVASEDKETKDETVIIRNKKTSAPEKTSATSEQVKTNSKAQDDLEELVEKDEVITDTQVTEEEVDDDESTVSQNPETASKWDSKSISTVVKTGAQKHEQQTGVKSIAVQHEMRGAASKVTAGRKAIAIPKRSRRKHGSPLKRREATEFLYLLQNGAEATGSKDSSVAAELMSKLKVSKSRNYTTYYVNRDKTWSANDDLNALMQRLQVSAAKIGSAREISVPYLETVQELQRISTKYIQDGYQASLGTQVKLQIKQFEKLQNAYYKVETTLQSESNTLMELAVKAICEIRSGMFKMECFKEQYPVFEKFLSPAEPDKNDCYGNVRKLSEWTKAAPELWKNKERRLNRLQGSLDNLKKRKQELQPGQNIKKSIAGLLCDIINYMDIQAKILNFSAKLESVAKLARREINICNKKEPINPTLADADK